MTARPKQTWRSTWFWDLVRKLEIFIIKHHKSLVQSSVIKIEPEWWLSPMIAIIFKIYIQDHRPRSSLAAPSSIKEVLVVVGISAVVLEDFKTFCVKVLASFYWQPLSTQVITSIILYILIYCVPWWSWSLHLLHLLSNMQRFAKITKRELVKENQKGGLFPAEKTMLDENLMEEEGKQMMIDETIRILQDVLMKSRKYSRFA